MRILLIICASLFTLSCTSGDAKLQTRVNNLEQRVDSLQVQLSMQKINYTGVISDSSKQISYSTGTVSFSSQCMGITKKGHRCTRKIKSGSYCWQHGG